MLPNTRGEPHSRGHIHPAGGGDWFLSLLANPFRLHLLPRGFKKHHLKLEGVWIQAVVYGTAKGVAHRELMIFTSDPNPVTMLWPRRLFSLACLTINTQRVRDCVRSVVSGTLCWALQGWKEFRVPNLLPEAERQPVWMVCNWAVFQTPRRGCISGRLL